MAAKGKQLLKTVDEVIEVLGGDNAVGTLLGVDYRHPWNWRTRKNFPPDTFLALTIALDHKGRAADPGLWRQRPLIAAE